MKQRLLFIDLVKIVAMFAVIGLHTFCGSRGYELAHLFYLSCVIGVPFFFMSSGYLLLGRNDISYKYIIIKIWHIIRVVFFFSFFYSIFAFYLIDADLLLLFIDCLSGSFIQRGDLWICWYLGAMMIIYILYPLINKMFINDSKAFLFFLFFLLLIESIVFYLNISMNGWEKNYVQTIRVWNWMFYFCLGGLIKNISELYINKKVLVLVCLIAAIGNIYIHELFANKIGEDACEYFYCSLVVIVMVTSSFLFLIRITIKPSMNKIISFLSKLFLPVYILHPLLLSVIMNPDVFSIIHTDWMPFYMYRFFLVSIITVPLSWILIKIPIVGKLIKI